MSNRNHTWREDAYECGEGPTCSIVWGPIIAAGISAAGSYLASRNSNQQQEDNYNRDAAQAEENKYLRFNPMVEPYARGIMEDAEGLYGNQGFSPGPNALQLLGRENTLGYAEGALPGMIGQAQGAWGDMLSGGMNPYVEQMIAGANNNLAQNFQRNALPYLSGQASFAGGYGSGRHQINEGVAAEGLAEAQGNATTSILNNAYNTGQSNQLSAMRMAPMMTGLGFMPSSTQREMGGLYQDDARDPARNLQGYAGMINPYAQQNAGGQVVSSPTPNSPWGSALGGALAGYGAGQSWQDQNAYAPWTGPPAGTNPSTGAAIPGPVGTNQVPATSSYTYGATPTAPGPGPFGY